MFGRMTILLGTEYSRLKPRNYWIFFIVVDVLSLILQGVGGGLSGEAAASGGGNLLAGRDVYLAGISFQLFNVSHLDVV